MVKLPSGEELKQLPLRALVAYTARCALRVRDLYRVDADHAEAEACYAAVESAINIAIEFAAGADVDETEAQRIEESVVRAVIVANEQDLPDRAAAFSSNAAYAAVNAVNMALASQHAASRATAASKAVLAAVTASDAAVSADPRVRHGAIRDWLRLNRLSLGAFPELGKSVDPTARGSLGPAALPGRKTARKNRGTNRSTETASKQNKQVTDGKGISERLLQLEVAEGKLKAEREAIEIQRRQLKGECETLDSERESLQSERERFLKETSNFERKLKEFREESSRREAEHECQLKELADEQECLVHAQQKQADEEAARVSHDRQQLEREREELQIQRDELLQERHQLETTSLEVQDARAAGDRDRSELEAKQEQFCDQQQRMRQPVTELHQILQDFLGLHEPTDA